MREWRVRAFPSGCAIGRFPTAAVIGRNGRRAGQSSDDRNGNLMAVEINKENGTAGRLKTSTTAASARRILQPSLLSHRTAKSS